MAAPNVNGRLNLTGVHQKSPASLDLYISYSFYKLLWYLNLCLIKLIPHRPLWSPWTQWHHSSKHLVHHWLRPWHPSPAPVPILHSTWSISDYVLDIRPLLLVLVPGPSVTTSLTSFPCSCARFPSTENTATPHTKGDGVKVFFSPKYFTMQKSNPLKRCCQSSEIHYELKLQIVISLLCISKYIFLIINIVWTLPYADDSVDKGDDNRVPE